MVHVRIMSPPPTSPCQLSSAALEETLAVLRMRFVVWERATVTQMPTAAKVSNVERTTARELALTARTTAAYSLEEDWKYQREQNE